MVLQVSKHLAAWLQRSEATGIGLWKGAEGVIRNISVAPPSFKAFGSFVVEIA